MKITWQVDDGYVGKSAPQETIIDDYELEECDSDSKREELISGSIQDDFEQKITWVEIGRNL